MNPAEIRALAFVVNHVRPSWPVKDIERALVDDPRGFTDVALAAVTAAASPDTRFPGGIKTTYAGSHGCQKCAERNTRAERNSQPPPITRCARCGRATEHDHACRSQRPDQWDEYQAFWRANLAQQRQLREAITNDPDNHELATTNRALIAELKAEVDARATLLDNDEAAS